MADIEVTISRGLSVPDLNKDGKIQLREIMPDLKSPCDRPVIDLILKSHKVKLGITDCTVEQPEMTQKDPQVTIKKSTNVIIRSNGENGEKVPQIFISRTLRVPDRNGDGKLQLSELMPYLTSSGRPATDVILKGRSVHCPSFMEWIVEESEKNKKDPQVTIERLNRVCRVTEDGKKLEIIINRYDETRLFEDAANAASDKAEKAEINLEQVKAENAASNAKLLETAKRDLIAKLSVYVDLTKCWPDKADLMKAFVTGISEKVHAAKNIQELVGLKKEVIANVKRISDDIQKQADQVLNARFYELKSKWFESTRMPYENAKRFAPNIMGCISEIFEKLNKDLNETGKKEQVAQSELTKAAQIQAKLDANNKKLEAVLNSEELDENKDKKILPLVVELARSGYLTTEEEKNAAEGGIKIISERIKANDAAKIAEDAAKKAADAAKKIADKKKAEQAALLAQKAADAAKKAKDEAKIADTRKKAEQAAALAKKNAPPPAPKPEASPVVIPAGAITNRTGTLGYLKNKITRDSAVINFAAPKERAKYSVKIVTDNAVVNTTVVNVNDKDGTIGVSKLEPGKKYTIYLINNDEFDISNRIDIDTAK
ncbi:MAG: hypothetical protein NTZ10_04800 [Candidatus Saganbacteria bacterium]|nr:hypothetical protein [Candidatus Saganbacteria bacterium]